MKLFQIRFQLKSYFIKKALSDQSNNALQHFILTAYFTATASKIASTKLSFTLPYFAL